MSLLTKRTLEAKFDNLWRAIHVLEDEVANLRKAAQASTRQHKAFNSRLVDQEQFRTRTVGELTEVFSRLQLLEGGGLKPQPATEQSGSWIVIAGTPADGFHHVGPFASPEDAIEYAKVAQDGCDWWVIELQKREV